MSVKLNHLLKRAEKALDKHDHASAGALFEEAVTLAPAAHKGWYGLGLVAANIGQDDTAATFFAQAAELQPDNVAYRQKLGETLARLGQIQEGLAHLQAARRLAPRDANVLCALSGGYVKAGDWHKAKAVLQEVVRLPHPQGAHFCLLGLACQHLGELDEALPALQKATALAPRFADAWLSLAHLYVDRNQLDKADDALRRLQELAPDAATTQALAGDVAWGHGNTREAAKFYAQAAETAPDNVDYRAKLAVALVMSGNALAAIDAMEECHRLGMPEDWILEKLGTLFTLKYWTPMARENLEMAVERNPDNLAAWNALLMTYARSGESENVRKAANAILDKEPDNLYALMNLTTWYDDQGRHDEAMELVERCLKIAPTNRGIYSKALWVMLSSSSESAADILAMARRMDELCLRALKRDNDFATRDRNPERRLKIGWVSSDLRQHPVAAFVQPFMPHLDHEALEIFVYYNFTEEDAITRQIKPCADHWRTVAGIGDDAFADLVEGDEIDILVDLNGFTDNGRTGAIARKPAPIVAGWLGFPGTSGMTATDYVLVPPDEVLERGVWCSETPWPLPHCYGVRENIANVAVQPGLPCERSDKPFTFACLNHFRKASVHTIELWSHILNAVPEARLVLVAIGGKDDATIKYFRSRFERHGANPDQVEFRGYVARQKYFDSYNEIDLGLDPFPFNGGTTGYDSIWMGVPFVTLPGEHLSARMGKAILENVGLQELVAKSADDYVDIAVKLARDHERLKALRANLRERMLASPLLDAPLMAKNLEEAFRGMWRRWCEKRLSAPAPDR
ncbi:MAG: tetratricopeptide repeat protein [Azoarcus sp.]|nr:tetratricopeptide repeat protein [Azoarcus sp.]